MTISNGTDSVTAVYYAIMGGKFRLHTREDGFTDVLDDDDNVIGSASRYPYGLRGWSVHTRPFAGFVPNDQVVFV